MHRRFSWGVIQRSVNHLKLNETRTLKKKLYLNVSNSRDCAFPFDVHNAQIVHLMGSMVTVLEKFNNFNDGTFEFMHFIKIKIK